MPRCRVLLSTEEQTGAEEAPIIRNSKLSVLGLGVRSVSSLQARRGTSAFLSTQTHKAGDSPISGGLQIPGSPIKRLVLAPRGCSYFQGLKASSARGSNSLKVASRPNGSTGPPLWSAGPQSQMQGHCQSKFNRTVTGGGKRPWLSGEGDESAAGDTLGWGPHQQGDKCRVQV